MKHFILSIAGCLLIPTSFLQAQSVYVASTGNDANPGTAGKPFATIAKAVASRQKEIMVSGGVYFLNEPLKLNASDSGLSIIGKPGEKVVISGGRKLALVWKPYKKGIMQAQTPDDVKSIDRLWVNGELQHMARYPNYDAHAEYLNGTAADAISPERVARWKNPAGGYLHAMQGGRWGDEHFLILGKTADNHLQLSQPLGNNRPTEPHAKLRYVENIFEELDAPGEWFFNAAAHTLYFFPPQGLDLSRAEIVASRLESLVEIRGTAHQPVRNVVLSNLTFAQTARTFTKSTEPLLRSDWMIYRGGVVFFNHAENCAVEDCNFIGVGGNALFVSGANRHIQITDCYIADAGASGVCFVGEPSAVRNPLFHYSDRLQLSQIDPTPGPKNDDYPMECTVSNCLIERIGAEELQSAGIEIDMARRISVLHCTIHDVPRAGINIGDGCWGGNLIEGCDVFDTVMQTNDHGAFNAWGRDRFWQAKFDGKPMPPNMPKWDTIEPNVLRNNRWQCAHGWDIDLDDGSSNYLIENNLCLQGGLKLRDGYFRTARNNIIRDTLHSHVWPSANGDVVEHNIVFKPYAPIGMPKVWGKIVDYNFLDVLGATVSPALPLQKISHQDQHSLMGDARFLNSSQNDYQLAMGSPVLQIGFQPFPLNQFGAQSTRLRAAAASAFAHRQQTETAKKQRNDAPSDFLGGRVKNLAGLDELSATGMFSETGVVVLKSPAGSPLARLGLRPNDVILQWQNRTIATMDDLCLASQKFPQPQNLTIWRNQSRQTLKP